MGGVHDIKRERWFLNLSFDDVYEKREMWRLELDRVRVLAFDILVRESV